MLFIIFDVEAIFLYPWAVEFRALGLFGLVEMIVFVGLRVRGLRVRLPQGRPGLASDRDPPEASESAAEQAAPLAPVRAGRV